MTGGGRFNLLAAQKSSNRRGLLRRGKLLGTAPFSFAQKASSKWLRMNCANA